MNDNFRYICLKSVESVNEILRKFICSFPKHSQAISVKSAQNDVDRGVEFRRIYHRHIRNSHD